MNSMISMIRWFGLICVLLATTVRAQSIGMGAGGVGPGDRAHGWVVIQPNPQAELEAGEQGWVLAHIAPRRADGKTSGTADHIADLASRPLAVASSGDTAYAVVRGAGESTRLRVISWRVEQVEELAGVWRLADESILPAPPEGVLAIDLAAAGDTVALLTETDGARTLSLSRRGGEWIETELPREASQPTLLSDGQSLAIVSPDASAEDSAGARWWTAEPAIGLSAADQQIVWREERRLETPASDLGDDLVLAGGRLWALESAGDGLALVCLSSDASDPVPVGSARPRAVVVIPGGRPRIVAFDRPGEDLRIVETSVLSGRVWYDGPVRRSIGIGPGEVRVLMAVLFMLSAAALVVVLRPGQSDHQIVLPEGTALAEPGRRMFATLVDLFASALIVGVATGTSPLGLLAPSALLSGVEGWTALAAVFVTGFTTSTLGEAFFGATLGKVLTGCRVIRVRADAPGLGGPPGFAASVMRNLLKWILPPVAALAVLTRDARHRGDVAAGAAVLIRVEPDPDLGAEDDES